MCCERDVWSDKSHVLFHNVPWADLPPIEIISVCYFTRAAIIKYHRPAVSNKRNLFPRCSAGWSGFPLRLLSLVCRWLPSGLPFHTVIYAHIPGVSLCIQFSIRLEGTLTGFLVTESPLSSIISKHSHILRLWGWFQWGTLGGTQFCSCNRIKFLVFKSLLPYKSSEFFFFWLNIMFSFFAHIF